MKAILETILDALRLLLRTWFVIVDALDVIFRAIGSIVGIAAGLLIGFLLAAGAFHVWPSDFFDTPFASMTFGLLGRALLSPIMLLAALPVGLGIANRSWQAFPGVKKSD